MSLHNLEIEKHFLACLVQYGPQIWGEVNILNLGPSDFSIVHVPLFNVLKAQLDAREPVTTIILTEKLKSYNINLEVDPYVYIEALRMKPVKPTDGPELLKELKRTTVRRELIEKCRLAENTLLAKPAASFDEMVGVVDKTLSSVRTDYVKSETTNLFENIIEVVEERGNNPVTVDDLGLMGPFPSINQTLGALSFAGSFTVIGARTGVGKSQLSFFYNLHLAEKHGLKILHLDANEMTVEQLQARAVCCMSGGEIPLWAIKSGEWRKNAKWTELIREDIWPRVKKLDIHYQNIGSLDADGVVNFIKRFYFKHVGRGGHLLINLDYIKGVETFSGKTAEYQAIGYYVDKLKNLITEQISASIWTSVQNNREGITTGKKAGEIVDSESSLSLSDRIIQQSTHGFSLRFKVPEELAMENNRFGNMRLTPLKTRESLGRQFERSLRPVKLPNGKFARNYYNLDAHGFSFTDKGDLVQMLDSMGHNPLILEPVSGEKLP